MIKPILFGLCVNVGVLISLIVLMTAWRIIVPLLIIAFIYFVVREIVILANSMTDDKD